MSRLCLTRARKARPVSRTAIRTPPHPRSASAEQGQAGKQREALRYWQHRADAATDALEAAKRRSAGDAIGAAIRQLLRRDIGRRGGRA